MFCIGDFFGDDEKEWEQFKQSGKIGKQYMFSYTDKLYCFIYKVSVPIYTLGPNKKQHEKHFQNLKDQQLAPNIYYLGKIKTN